MMMQANRDLKRTFTYLSSVDFDVRTQRYGREGRGNNTSENRSDDKSN